jgi:hypothetical protein
MLNQVCPLVAAVNETGLCVPLSRKIACVWALGLPEGKENVSFFGATLNAPPFGILIVAVPARHYY